jgi:hypothetical protein
MGTCLSGGLLSRNALELSHSLKSGWKNKKGEKSGLTGIKSRSDT